MKDIEQKTSVLADLVVIGSSAGGIEALSILVSTLPTDFPAPIVIAQHLDPNRPSTLDFILQRRTNLPVELVTSASHLEAGKIYVVPANRHVSIQDHEVKVQEDHIRRPRPSVDMLLSSAAEVYGDHLIAVILTGSGSDGAAGAVDVKDAGGMVIVQDPQTARYPSMPLALPPTIVDFAVNIEQIGPLLYDIITGVEVPPIEEQERVEDILQSILEQVSRQASIDFRPYKTSTILRRIGRRMTVTHNRTMQDYLEYIKTNPEEIGKLVKALLINVTQFFRDTDAFVYLKSDILPKLIAQARSRDKMLRFWTAGCATGEEPYSLAMLLTDILGEELPEWSIKIFATDLDEATINFARRGVYSETLLKGMKKEYRERFFERIDQGYRISKTLRQMVIFGQQDLSRSAPFPRIHLALCRNVLIYFAPELQDYVLNQFTFSLCPNGYLFLGKAETIRPTQSYYEIVNKTWKVYRCIGKVLPLQRRQSFSELSTSQLAEHLMNRSSRNPAKQHTDQELVQPPLELGQLRRVNEVLLRFLPVGIMVIDRGYHILTSNGSARRLLGLRDNGIEQDFLHAVRGIPYSTTRAAIDSVFRERNAISLTEVELEVTTGGNGRFVSLVMALMQMEPGSPDLAVISISDVTEQVQIRKQHESTQAEQAQLMNELSAVNKRLSDVNKELMDTNEELQITNEELLLTHEELQASIEEFETTNEELHATNEELETTNEELRARTGELQEVSYALENERRRLDEIVTSAPFYIVVLRGPTLLVEAYNPCYARQLEGKTVRGRPLQEAFDLLWDDEVGMSIIRIAQEVYQMDATRTISKVHIFQLGTQGQEKQAEERYFTYTLAPSHNVNGKVDGVIIYAVDETEQRTRDIEEEGKRLRLIFDKMQFAILGLYDASTGQLVIGSPTYLDVIGRAHPDLPTNTLLGRSWQETTLLPASEATHQWQTVLEKRSPQYLPEVRYQFANEQQDIIWDYSLTPIMDNESTDQVRFVLVSAINVTRQVQARLKLERRD